jgi:poly(3-hydroxybutyrate) depolymerase
MTTGPTTSTIAFHGTADTRVPMNGVTYGTSVHPPVVSWATGWAVRNGCAAAPVRAAVTGGQVLRWQGCRQQADVALFEVTGARTAGSRPRSTPTA